MLSSCLRRIIAFADLCLAAGLAGGPIWLPGAPSRRGVIEVDKLGQAQAVSAAIADYQPTGRADRVAPGALHWQRPRAAGGPVHRSPELALGLRLLIILGIIVGARWTGFSLDQVDVARRPQQLAHSELTGALRRKVADIERMVRRLGQQETAFTP
jgi:hypothetical protein